MDPSQLLLVLLLLADPSAKPSAEAVQVRLQDTADGAKVPLRFVVGPEAFAALKKDGLTDGDLLSGPSVGEAYTRTRPRTLIIRIERRESGGNVVVESRVWLQGRAESHVAICDLKTGNPLESTARGVAAITSPWLTAGAVPDVATSDAAVAALADGRKWHEVLAAPATGTARNGYYRIMALVRMQRANEAEEALTALKKAHPDHVMTKAAEGLVHPTGATPEVDINNAQPADDGTNVLR